MKCVVIYSSAAQIFLETQCAYVTLLLAHYHESLATGPSNPSTYKEPMQTSCDLLSDLQVETYSSMERREKTELILEQMRLLIVVTLLKAAELDKNGKEALDGGEIEWVKTGRESAADSKANEHADIASTSDDLFDLPVKSTPDFHTASPTAATPPLSATDPVASHSVAPPSLISCLQCYPGSRTLATMVSSPRPSATSSTRKSPSVPEYNRPPRETPCPGEPIVMLVQGLQRHAPPLPPSKPAHALSSLLLLPTAISSPLSPVLEAHACHGTALLTCINTSDGSSKIPLYSCITYVALLRSYACHEQVDAAIHVLTALEACTDLKPVAAVYKYMIRVFLSPNGINEAGAIDFVTRSTEGAIDWTATYDDPNGPCRQHIHVYNQMIEAHFRAGALSAPSSSLSA
ncbi:hypothetical protein B0H11DRAFT_2220162 [Mycena galericulata]|nr:hypothetical protein B0H11DRAFT_2220162 [Mycena galericulata]